MCAEGLGFVCVCALPIEQAECYGERAVKRSHDEKLDFAACEFRQRIARLWCVCVLVRIL